MQKIYFIIVFSCLSFEALAISAKDRLTNALAVSSTLQGRFTQSTPGLKRQSGSFKVKRPNKFIWQYDGKDGQKIISTGRQVWIVEPDLEHAYIVSLRKALGKSPALILLNPGSITKEFKLKNAGKSKGLEWVELIPKKKANAEFEHLYVGLSSTTIKQIKLIDALSRTTLIKFKGLNFDVPLSNRLFKYSPPSDFDTF